MNAQYQSELRFAIWKENSGAFHNTLGKPKVDVPQGLFNETTQIRQGVLVFEVWHAVLANNCINFGLCLADTLREVQHSHYSELQH